MIIITISIIFLIGFVGSIAYLLYDNNGQFLTINDVIGSIFIGIFWPIVIPALLAIDFSKYIISLLEFDFGNIVVWRRKSKKGTSHELRQAP